MRKKTPNEIRDSLRFSGYNRLFGVDFWVHLYTDSHLVRSPALTSLATAIPPVSRRFLGFAPWALTRRALSDISGLCLPVNPKN